MDWTISVKNGKLVVKPPKYCSLVCPFCWGDMLLHHIKVHNSFGGWAVDIMYKCPRCGYAAVFGVAIPEEKAKELMEFSRKLVEHDEEVVKKRLESWGYW